MSNPYVDFPQSRKGDTVLHRLGVTLRYESAVEDKTAMLLDASPEVVKVERAASIDVYRPDGTAMTYVPDYIVTLGDGQVYTLDCKPPTFVFNLVDWSCKAALLEQLRRPLRIVTDDDCPDHWLDQVKTYRTFFGMPGLPAIRERILTVLPERGPMPLTEMRKFLKTFHAPGEVDSTLNGMLARGELLLDTHAPWKTCHVDVPGGRLPPPRAPLGTLFADLPHGRTEPVQVDLPPPEPASHRAYKASRRGQQYLRLFSLYPDPTLLLDREEAQRLGDEVGVTGRTVYRFREALLAAGAPGITFDELLPHLVTVGYGRPRRQVTLDIVEIIEDTVAKRYFLPPTSPGRLGSVAALHEVVRRTCLDRRLSPPAYNTVHRHLQLMCRRDPVIAERLRYGQERAQQLEIRHGHLDISRYGELISVDCSPANVFVVDGAGRGAASTRGKGQGQGKGRPYRPTQVVICDVATSQILRIATLPGAARAVDILRLLKEVFLGDVTGLAGLETVPQASGLPTMIRMDAGTEFANRAVSGALQHLGIEVLRRHKGVKHHGGVEERIIKDITHAHHALPGTSMHNIQARGEHDAQRRAALSLTELQAFNAALLQRHNSLVRAPSDKTRQAHAQDLIDTGRSVWRPLSDAQREYVEQRLYPSEQRAYKRDGVSLFGLTYTHFGTVRGLGVGDHVAVSYDPDDISVVHVYNPATGQQIPFQTRLPHGIEAPLSLAVWDVLKRRFAEAKQTAKDGVQTQAQIVDEVLDTHRQRVAKEKADNIKTKAKEKARTKTASILPINPIKRQGRAASLIIEHEPLEA